MYSTLKVLHVHTATFRHHVGAADREAEDLALAAVDRARSTERTASARRSTAHWLAGITLLAVLFAAIWHLPVEKRECSAGSVNRDPLPLKLASRLDYIRKQIGRTSDAARCVVQMCQRLLQPLFRLAEIAMEAQTTDPLASRLLQDIIMELEAGLSPQRHAEGG
jgi:hypothetical protein